MNVELINIENISFSEANNIIIDLCNQNIKFSNEEINFILSLEEKEIAETFLYKYKYFDYSNFEFIKEYTNLNLDNKNKDYVSDLIYFALDFGLDLDYKKIISFLITDKNDEECFILACLEYLHQNIKFLYIEELVNNLKYIRNNVFYNQNEQLLASLLLFRITHKTEYLNFIKELIEFDKSNLVFLKNTFKSKMYEEKYFDNHSLHLILPI